MLVVWYGMVFFEVIFVDQLLQEEETMDEFPMYGTQSVCLSINWWPDFRNTF